MFDTLAIARRLTDAGIEPAHADALTAAIRDAAEHHRAADLATRADLAAQYDRIDARITAQDDRIDARITAQDDHIDARLAAQDDRIDARLAAQDDRFDAKLAAQDDRTDARLAALEARIYRAMLLQAGVIVGAIAAILRFAG